MCVQYMAPIMKNRQINFPPIGENFFVGTSARPNEITYTEDWMRPDFVPPHPLAPPPAATTPPADAPMPDEAAAAPPASTPPPGPGVVATDPAAGLSGLMAPADLGGGS